MAPSPLPDYPGLTSAQVAERIARGEVNEFKIKVGRTYWQILRDNIFNLFNLVLATLGAIMVVFQDYTNLLFASFSVVMNSLVGLIQEISAKRALDKLAAMAMQQVRIWRDGALVEVPLNQIVKDDVIPVEPGDRIAVDGRVVQADSLEMNEALLTGESDAVLKEKDDMLYSGSFVIAGSGTIIATQVGAQSTINRLSATAKAYRHPLTPTQRRINSLVQIMVLVMLLFGPMTIIAGFVSRLPTIEIVRNAVVLVTSMVPQGLVLVTTISLAIGALVISRNRTLVQRINAVESMANVNVLCFDKTGTLTRNQLAVVQIIPLNEAPEAQIRRDLSRYVNSLAHQNRTAHAVAEYVGANGSTPEAAKVREIPFTSARKWGAVVFAEETLIMGAPERVLDPARSGQAVQTAHELSTQGQRVLAFARAGKLAEDGQLGQDRQPIALIVMSDQIRPEIGETIRAFAEQGVELKVISGDNLETVRAIAHQAGMRHAEAYTGDQIEAMDPGELHHAVRASNIFARIEPETKRKIIAALKAQGHYVAMVGDGVNDVPALKEANMAVAMNDGAQIAKDVADIVLLDNSMATLPLAFERGKLITQKIFGSTKLFLVKNFYTVLAFIFIGFMALPFPSTPILISWLTFGVVNIAGGLITFGLLRPAPMHGFMSDVIRYVVSGTIVGAAVMSALYAGIYLYRFDAAFKTAIVTVAPGTTARLAAGAVEPDPQADKVAISLAHELAALPARDAARSALYMFMALYGMVVFWNIMGIDVFRPHTLLERLPSTLLGLAFAAITILPPYFVGLFENFVPPTPGLWLAVIVGFVVATVGLHYIQRDPRIAGIGSGSAAPV